MKRAFTLIELLISISILSILMLFLYKSYAELGKSNHIYKKRVEELDSTQKIRKVFYMDFLKGFKKSVVINKDDSSFDMISLMTKNSLHRRINPYVSYIVKDGILYRLESQKQIKSLEIPRDTAFDVDKIAEVKRVKLFVSQNKQKALYLLYVKFVKHPKLLLKLRVLN